MPLHWMPTMNACLNATAAGLLVAGYLAIRAGRRQAHHRLMLSALGSSALFLVSYLYYHAHAGATRFAGEGIVRWIYFAVLGSHTVLAVLVLPLVGVTLHRALRERLHDHRRTARVTLPVWLYVSVTGVMVYVMLYHLVPSR